MTVVSTTVARLRPTLWGLTPAQIHDRFWARRGVQVVRRGERSEIVEGAELFLLTDPDSLVLFRLRELVETLAWVRPDVLLLRLHDGRDIGYREHAITDGAGRFVRFDRTYGRVQPQLIRVALTPEVDLARAWQVQSDTRAGWRMLRARVPAGSRIVRALRGRVYDRTSDQDVMDCVKRVVAAWGRPDGTIRGIRRLSRDVWTDPSARVDDEATLVGSVWIGAGRDIPADAVAVGPTVFWDDPAAKPSPDAVLWQEIEPEQQQRTLPRPKPLTARPPGKRIFDILFSIMALSLTLPLWPIIALAVLIEDGWPVFFAHRRETLRGREFPCLKFRTMRRNADVNKDQLAAQNVADGPQFFMANDPRTTRVGRLLRATQMDELPQFLNVLLGHMSVVGPRPSPYEENQFCPSWREARLSVRPGVTGLWQIRRTRQQGLDFQEWIRFDLEYVDRESWRLDLFIIAKTVVLLVGRVFRA
jgi:lipopolysaccharide/colanic/teichoic acid biosynthesis glycosyltransferase